MQATFSSQSIARIFAIATFLSGAAHADMALPKNARIKPRPEITSHAEDHAQEHAGNVFQRQREQMAFTASKCSPDALTAYRGAQLVEKVKTSDCSRALFNVSAATANYLFNEEQMMTMASEFRNLARNYDGSNSDNILDIQEYLRAGYYYRATNNPQGNATFSEALKLEIRASLDRLFASYGSRAVTWQNGDVMQSAYKLISHTKDYGYFMPTLKAKLNDARGEFVQKNGTAAAIYELLRLFDGLYYYDKAGTAALRRDTSYLYAANDFYNANSKLIGTQNEYVLSAAMGVIAGMLEFPELKTHARPLVRKALSETALFGRGESIWLYAARKIKENDGDNCNYYGTCNAKEKWEAAVLTSSRQCSPTIKIKSQGYSQSDLALACQLLEDEHKLFGYSLFGNKDPRNNNAIPTKYDGGLEVIAFKSKSEYSKYGGAIYAIDTNNGGITMEGDPSQPGNIQRFYAYHKDGQPLIWNLKHEFIHYLDNIYNIENYGKAYWSGQPIVWWMEGIAEYFSHENDYPEAIAAARLKTYPLSTIFRNTYEMADYQSRAYNWGYLAMRFMFERHRDDVELMAQHMRVGKYDEYGKVLFEKIGTRYDNEFYSWLSTVENGGSFAGARYAGGRNNGKGAGNGNSGGGSTGGSSGGSTGGSSGNTTFDAKKQYFNNDQTQLNGKSYTLIVLVDGVQAGNYGLYGSTVAPGGSTFRSTDGRVMAYWITSEAGKGGTGGNTTPSSVKAFDAYSQYRHGDQASFNGKIYAFNVRVDGTISNSYGLYGGSCSPDLCGAGTPFRTSDGRVSAYWQEVGGTGSSGSNSGGSKPASSFSEYHQYWNGSTATLDGRSYSLSVWVDGKSVSDYGLYGGSCHPARCTESRPWVSTDGRAKAYWR